MRQFVLLFLLVPVLSFAQDSVDPEAKVILDKISTELNSNEKVQLMFDLTIKFPGADESIKEGKLVQDGDKFTVDVGAQTILCNGVDLYMINKEMKSAQLSAASSMEDSQGMMNPKQMLTMYDSGDYYYAITGEEDYKGKRVLNIEFKPKDRYAEFFKMRMAVDKETNKPIYIKLFNKDGSQFILELKSLIFPKSIDNSQFEFSTDAFPGISVEDLRID
ncbi:outer membrane lipoprotein carrier protein LolA [Saprospiraceae bacterium]|nr:outer membrane lipoprotein carrier protein LolA [Saprospiraceae bacterium]